MYDLSLGNTRESEPFLSVSFFTLSDAARFMREELGAPDEFLTELSKTGAMTWTGEGGESVYASFTGPDLKN